MHVSTLQEVRFIHHLHIFKSSILVHFGRRTVKVTSWNILFDFRERKNITIIFILFSFKYSFIFRKRMELSKCIAWNRSNLILLWPGIFGGNWFAAISWSSQLSAKLEGSSVKSRRTGKKGVKICVHSLYLMVGVEKQKGLMSTKMLCNTRCHSSLTGLETKSLFV